MNKKFLSLVLALVMVLGAFTTVFAADDKKAVEVPKLTTNDQKVNWLRENGIVVGHKVNEDEKNNDLALDKNVKRSEVTKLLVFAIGKQDLADKVKGLLAVYPDVPVTHWANGYIFVGTTEASPANKVAFLAGYPDKTFKPEREVTYAELAKMLVVLTKKDLTQDMVNKAQWPTTWITWAQQLGFFEGLSITDVNKAAPRKDAFVMLFNGMYAMKEIKKEVAGEVLGVVSNYNADKKEITLNQGDKAKTFTVKDSTNVVDAGKGGRTADNDKEILLVNLAEIERKHDVGHYFVGSLVRIIANDKNEASHIVQLGNPRDLAIRNLSIWKGVAEEVVETTETEATAEIQTAKDKIKINGLTLNILSSTRIFVSDVKNNHLTELANINEAIKLLDVDSISNAKHVYAGYNIDGSHKDATVIVFNKVDDKNVEEDLFRVVTAPGQKSGYAGVVETEEGKEVHIDLKFWRDAWPNHYDAENLDVVRIQNRAQGYLGQKERIITHRDHKNFPIVTVYSVDGSEIKLEDKDGRIQKFELNRDKKKDSYDIENRLWVFGADKPAKGQRVQFDTDSEGHIYVLSVLKNTISLEGKLKEGKSVEEFTGKLVQVTESAGGDRLYISVEESKNIADTERRDPEEFLVNIPRDAADFISRLNAIQGYEITFTIQKESKEHHKVAIITDAVLKAAEGKKHDDETALEKARKAVEDAKNPLSVVALEKPQGVEMTKVEKEAAVKKAVEELIKPLTFRDHEGNQAKVFDFVSVEEVKKDANAETYTVKLKAGVKEVEVTGLTVSWTTSEKESTK